MVEVCFQARVGGLQRRTEGVCEEYGKGDMLDGKWLFVSWVGRRWLCVCVCGRGDDGVKCRDVRAWCLCFKFTIWFWGP